MTDKRLCIRYDGPSGWYCRNVSYFQDGPHLWPFYAEWGDNLFRLDIGRLVLRFGIRWRKF